MNEPADPIDMYRLLSGLDPKLRKGTFVFEASVGSTNDVAMALVEADRPLPILVVAEEQTQGRGRRGAVWEAPKGVSLLCSLALPYAGDAARAALLSPCVAIAAAEVITEVAGQPAWVKWPNDVLLGDKKVAGILLEARIVGGRQIVVIGMGINVNTPGEFFSERGLDRATSLSAANDGRSFDRSDLLRRLIASVASMIELASEQRVEELQRRFEAVDMLSGRRITFAIGPNVDAAEVVRIDLERGLLVMRRGQPEWLEAGHVHIVDWG